MTCPWDPTDETDDDFTSGNYGARDAFEGWPEEAYLNHPMYMMFRTQEWSEYAERLRAGYRD